MEVLKFTLSGRTAFFKKPDTNTYVNLTYNHIPRTHLLGIFGSILGYDGYAQTSKKEFPEFYKKLKDLKISIVPKEIYFDSKIQRFNNSTGFASNETGGTLIVREVWLNNPSWDIYVKLDNEEADKIKEFLLRKECEFLPYLGSNDHFANISDVSIESFHKTESKIINSIVYEDDVNIKGARKKIYKEILPIGFNKNKNYIYERFVCTENQMSCLKDIYSNEKVNLVFY